MTKSRTVNLILTIGHSTRTTEEFLKLLRTNGVTAVADIRTIPRSRHNPQFNKETLPGILVSAGLKYIHVSGLGGLRRPLLNSPNAGWRNASFRGYADFMQSEEFGQALDMVVELATKEVLVLMCAEALPWRCHRSLIADALVVRGLSVEHIMGSGTRKIHSLTPWATVTGGSLTYPPEVPDTPRTRLARTKPYAGRRPNGLDQRA